jgi:hypothetical protein
MEKLGLAHGLNQQPLDYEPDALSIELTGHKMSLKCYTFDLIYQVYHLLH